ncbi:MAG: NAD(+)/NADH kinase [Sulfolobales archaeon]|nr:NAD(+)/NADH kinase [Ignisphaera sp.]MCX8199716.1 NAD(+)/NADH kinase [Sulfolobales archaeon]MDW8085865.1 NAD(+)/NADH kinase [Ignisphaera sp.]
MNIKRVGIVVKKGSSQGYEIAEKLLSYGSRVLNLDVYIDDEVLSDIKWDRVFRVGVDPVDLIVVIGGDGTFLRTFHRIGTQDTPIMGVRIGRRGFLLDVRPDEAADRLRDAVEGRCRLIEYMRLEVSLDSSKKSMPLALNDVVVAGWRYTRAKVISFSVRIENEHIYSVDGDGVIVATPLGSSAYALSAGGPIIDVDLESIVIVPLAPIQFNAKPIVTPSSKLVEVLISSDSGPVACIVDGQSIEVVEPGGSILVRKSTSRARVLRFRKVNTYARLHEI